MLPFMEKIVRHGNVGKHVSIRCYTSNYIVILNDLVQNQSDFILTIWNGGYERKNTHTHTYKMLYFKVLNISGFLPLWAVNLSELSLCTPLIGRKFFFIAPQLHVSFLRNINILPHLQTCYSIWTFNIRFCFTCYFICRKDKIIREQFLTHFDCFIAMKILC